MADARQHSWRLVWCYEHVFKWDNCEEVAQLTKSAGQYGGTFCGVKHPCKLEATLSRCNDRLPFILITDLRALIQCMTALGSKTCVDSPLQVFVLCHNNRQVGKVMARVSQWVNPSMQIWKCCEATLKSATSVLEDLMMTGIWPFEVPMAAWALPVPSNPNPRKNCRNISFQTSAGAQGIQQETSMTSLTRDSMGTTCNHGLLQQDPLLMHTHLVTSPMPLDSFIKWLLLKTDPKKLKQMLEDAMPMAYID